MRVYGQTDIGQSRLVNQDYIFYSKTSVGSLPNLFIVADGMGGHRAGDYASSFAVNTFVEKVRISSYENPISIIKNALQEVNFLLYQEAKKSVDFDGMGTTFVAAVIVGNVLCVVNVGDSRLYVIGDTIRQITRDHSLVEEMVLLGEIDRNEAKYHEKKNIITRAVGVNETVMADFFEIELNGSESILLCSDGLTNMVEDSEIFYICSNEEQGMQKMEEQTKAKILTLIELANRNGGKDNISAVLVDL